MEGSIREQDFSIYLKSYYLMELAFYTSVLFSLFIDAKRKDFYQQFLHHIVTILLVLTLYAIVQFRVKTVIIFLHDSTDYWLEAAEVFNYAKKHKICDNLFVFLHWLFSCLNGSFTLSGFYIVSFSIVGTWLDHIHLIFFFTTLLCTPQVLHLYWGMLTVKTVYQFTVAKDTLSEDGSSGDEKRDKPWSWSEKK